MTEPTHNHRNYGLKQDLVDLLNKHGYLVETIGIDVKFIRHGSREELEVLIAAKDFEQATNALIEPSTPIAIDLRFAEIRGVGRVPKGDLEADLGNPSRIEEKQT